MTAPGRALDPNLPAETSMNREKHLFAKFTGSEIFLEQGRLLFTLLHIFAQGGYRIHLYNNLADKDLDKYGKLVYTLPDLDLTDAPPAETGNWLYLHDQLDSSIARQPWHKRIQVRFDMFAPFHYADPIIMPFPMHPLQVNTSPEQIEAARSRQRTLRIFFSGDTNHYGREWVRYPSPKLPRKPIIDAIIADLGPSLQIVDDPAVFRGLGQGGYINKCVITASSEIRIEPQDWLDTLTMSDFFLSPPGIVMPMCHNIIEAMAVGAIPITNYPEWLDPHLRHMENCIVFDDRADLIAKLNGVLAMGEAEIARLRRNVIEYYDAHMRPVTFIDRIERHPDPGFPILMYTERNMAKNPKKLGKHSILMQGTTLPRQRGWVAAMAKKLLGN